VGGLALLLAVALAPGPTRASWSAAARGDLTSSVDPDEEKKEPLSQRLLARGSVPIVSLAALAINLSGAAYLVGLKTSRPSTTPPARTSSPSSASTSSWDRRVGAPRERLVLCEWPRIAIVLATVFGVFLIIRGIVNA
jgi:hypothetical protein